MSKQQTVTESLNAESNLAVSTLLINAENRKKTNRKRLRSEIEENVIQSPFKKRKIDDSDTNNIPAPLIIADDKEEEEEEVIDNKNENKTTFGFSSDDDDDDENDDEDEESDDNEFDIDLFNDNNNNHNDNNRNNMNDIDLNEDNSLKNDPYWNMMQSINESKNNLMDLDDTDNDEKTSNNNNKSNKDKEFKGVSIQIDVDDQSMFNLQNVGDKIDKKNKKERKKKKEVKKYQKWQRDQGIECTRSHLSLLVYRARFRTLLCSDCELQSRMMSILPLRLHPFYDTFNNAIYTEITFNKLRDLMRWFLNSFNYDDNIKQFELKCEKPKDRIPCGIFQLIEYIEDVANKINKRKCSISHLNMLFLTLLWSFNIPARYVYVLRPISHILTVNKIFDNNYTQIMDQYFKSSPCVCQQLDDENYVDNDGDIDIQNASNTNNKSPKNKKKNRNNKENSGEVWDENHDLYLWNHRDDDVEGLALHFGRTRTAIRNRLEHIVDPKHIAFQRLHGDNPPINDDKDKSVKRREIDMDNNNNNNSDESVDIESNKENMDIDDDEESKKKKKSFKKRNSNKKWRIEDDIYLWEYRDDPVDILGNILKRTKTGIKRRLESLRNPSSKPRQRLFNNLSSKSKSKLSLNKNKISEKSIKSKKRVQERRPDFNYLGQTFVYNKNKGSMIECIEVYIADRKEWVHVLLDKGRIHIDLSENNLNQCDCERNNNKINYCIAIDKFGCIKDVTPRYAEIWSVALKNRVMHNVFYNEMILKWDIENKQIALQYGWQYILEDKLWRNLLKTDEIQINKCIQSEPIPKSEGLFRNHPLYVIEKFVKKYEAIYPLDETQVIGKIRGENVYPISNLRDLHTRERWYKLGYVVCEGEKFIKQVKTSHMSKSDEEFTDLYGKWQCKKYIAPNIGRNDKLPTNHRGNIELWSDVHLPKGCLHITRNGAIFAAKRMKIEYAKAMIGFDQRKGRSVPVFDGLVIHKSHEKELYKIIDEMDIKRKQRAKEKEMKEMCGLWRILVQGIMVRHQLTTQAKEKEANKKIVTTKEFNASMMNQDHIEDL